MDEDNKKEEPINQSRRRFVRMAPQALVAGVAAIKMGTDIYSDTIPMITLSKAEDAHEEALRKTIEEFRKKDISAEITTGVVGSYLDRIADKIKQADRESEVSEDSGWKSKAGLGLVTYMGIRQVQDKLAQRRAGGTDDANRDSPLSYNLNLKRVSAGVASGLFVETAGESKHAGTLSTARLEARRAGHQEALRSTIDEHAKMNVPEKVTTGIVESYLANVKQIMGRPRSNSEKVGDALPVAAMAGLAGATTYFAADRLREKFKPRTSKVKSAVEDSPVIATVPCFPEGYSIVLRGADTSATFYTNGEPSEPVFLRTYAVSLITPSSKKTDEFLEKTAIPKQNLLGDGSIFLGTVLGEDSTLEHWSENFYDSMRQINILISRDLMDQAFLKDIKAHKDFYLKPVASRGGPQR